MVEEHRNYHGKYLLTLVFASLFLVSLGMIPHNAFAMGDAPGTCPNRYDGPITSFIINNGTQTFDAIANPGVTFDVNYKNGYNVTFIIHTQNVSSQNNTLLGTTWYGDNAWAFYDGHCVPADKTSSIGPNQDVTISRPLVNPHAGEAGYYQQVDFATEFPHSDVTYNVQWITPPQQPTNLIATTISTSQINLSWTAPANSGGSPITGYMIERSTDGGSTWNTLVGNTGSTSTTYSDTGLASGVTYDYRVSAINSAGTSLPSNTASASTPSISLSSYWADCCFGTLQVTGSVQNPISGINQMQLLIYAPNGNLVLNQTESTGEFQADDGISRSDGKGNYTIIGTYDNSTAKQLLPSWINNNPSVSVQVSEDTTGSVFIFGMISNDIAGENASVVITNSTNSTLATYASGSGMHGEVNQNIDSASAAKIFTQSANYNIIVTHIPTGIKGEKILAYTIPPPPQPPTNLSATAASSSQINLSWTAPANNGGPAITGYMIERSANGGSTWSTIVSNTGSTTTTYSDSGLAHSTTYTYRISAINDFGTGQPSNTASATTFNTVPTPPTGLTANAQLLKINLSWNAPSDNGGTPITGYMIERSTNNGNTWSTVVANTGSAGTTYSDTNVLPLTTYTYRVSAINDIGTGNPSNTASASITHSSTLP